MTTPVSLTLEASQFAAVALFCAKQDVRFYLKGVAVHTDKSGSYIVGCDGHTLAVHKIDDEPRDDRSIIIPDDVVAAVSKIKRGSITIDCGAQAGPFDGHTPRTCQIRTAIATYAFNEIEGKFPDWIRVAKHTQSSEPAFFNPEYLMRVHKAAELARGGKQKYPVLVSPGGTGCGFAQLDRAGMTCAWIMPMRGTLSELPTHPAFSLSN